MVRRQAVRISEPAIACIFARRRHQGNTYPGGSEGFRGPSSAVATPMPSETNAADKSNPNTGRATSG